MFSSVSRGDEGKLLLSEDRVRETLIEGVRDYLIVWHLPLRDCVIVNMQAPWIVASSTSVRVFLIATRPSWAARRYRQQRG